MSVLSVIGGYVVLMVYVHEAAWVGVIDACYSC